MKKQTKKYLLITGIIAIILVFLGYFIFMKGNLQINGCSENWQCSAFGNCVNGVQTRNCNDLNNCGTNINKPTEEKSCGTISFETNAINGNYKLDGVWIQVNGILYTHQVSSSYDCLPANVFILTPEGNPICTRTGYTTSQRVHMNYGTGSLLFTP